MNLYTDTGYYTRRNRRGRLHGGLVPGGGLGQCSWLQGGDGSYFWGETLANGSVMSCPTPAPSAPPTSPTNSPGQNIVNENEAWADNPYLNSPAYLAAEAASGAAPNTPAVNTLSELQTYCEQNFNNSQLFGDPLDTVTCVPGGGVNPTYVTQANALVASTPVVSTPPVVTTPRNAVTPPATGNPLTGSTQSAQNGLNPGNSTQGGGGATQNKAAVTCAGLGIGACIGPLDAGTWALIAAGVVVLLIAVHK